MLPLASIKYLLLAFEGPDPYSRAGGLATRLNGLGPALAEAGYEVHHFFIGDPHRPEEEIVNRVHLHRWGRELSLQYPLGCYHGEEEKLAHLASQWPSYVLKRFLEPAVHSHQRVVVLAEDWQVAPAVMALSDLAWQQGLRHGLSLVWNANNPFGFDRIDWHRLNFVANVTTVSRWMKHMIWPYGVNPVVIPNGIPNQDLAPVDPSAVQALRTALDTDWILVKVGRYDPDKRWAMAIRSLAEAKRQGFSARMIVRGGMESHGEEIRALAQSLGLVWNLVPSWEPWPSVLHGVDGDILELASYLPDGPLRVLYRAADAVLANSGREPFGLVGLEVMGAGGIAFIGATGEDYGQAFQNAIVVETDDPREIVHHLATVKADPLLSEQIRRQALVTANLYRWPVVIQTLDRWITFFLDGSR